MGTNHPPVKCSESPHRPLKIAKLSDEDDEPEAEENRTMGQNPRTFQQYLVAIEYIGTRFFGAQQQTPNCRTVVGVLQIVSNADMFVASCRMHFTSSSVSQFPFSARVVRTSGTWSQLNTLELASLVLNNKHPIAELSSVFSSNADMFVASCRMHFTSSSVSQFPFSARVVRYFYRILSGPEHISTFEKDRARHVPEDLDLSTMQKACKVLVGLHDFSSFRASGCQAKSPIRNLDELNVIEVFPSPYFPSDKERETQNSMCIDSEGQSCNFDKNKVDRSTFELSPGFGLRKRHRCFVVTARARSFLYHQVRFLVGAIKSVGTGDLTVSDVERILEAKTVTANGPMAPACGLESCT
ncbi:hypothetical protein LXL04_034535 [Taraxacum kok-saghyz]